MDELTSYLREIAEFPDFRDDHARVSELVEQMRGGDRQASLSLIESALRYIVELATVYCYRWGAWRHYTDLVQEANAEVSEWIEKYDPAEAPLTDFVSFRAHVSFVRYWNRSKTVHMTDYGRKILRGLRRARTELAEALGREPTLEELSERVGRGEAEVYAMQKHPRLDTLTIDDAREFAGDGKAIDLDSLATADFDPFRSIEAAEVRELLVTCLGPKDADLLLAYEELKTDGFRQLFAQYHGREISADAARQAKARLLKKLKRCLRLREQLFGGGEKP